MIQDIQTLLSDDQNLAQAAGTYVSTNTIDLAAAGTDALGNTVPKDAGKGTPTRLVIQVTETFTSGGAATLKAQIIMSANADLSSPTILASSEAIALATLVAGYKFRLGFVPEPGLTARYLGVQYVIATAAMTAGKCTAGIVLDDQSAP